MPMRRTRFARARSALAAAMRAVPDFGIGLGFFFGARFSSDSSRLPPAGRSRMWPNEDFTTKALPRYLLIVLALAGDSTITRERGIPTFRKPAERILRCSRKPDPAYNSECIAASSRAALGNPGTLLG